MSHRLEEEDFELQETGNDTTRASSLENLEDPVRATKTIGEKFLSKFKCLNHIGAIIILLIILLILGGFCAFAAVLFITELGCGEVQDHLNKYSTVVLEQTTSYTQISTEYSAVITQLKKAADVMGEIYRDQMWSENSHLRAEILPTACHGKPLALFDLNFGPWVRVSNDESFVKEPFDFLAEKPKHEVPEKKLAGAAFYPENVTESEIKEWINELDSTAHAEATSFYTVIKESSGKLTPVKYSTQYEKKLAKAVKYLHAAANLLTNPKDSYLKSFLQLRADAFTSNNYELSDIAWLNMTDSNSVLEVTIGPYETYDDELMGLKAAFEAYIGYKDSDSTKFINVVLANLQAIETGLPMDTTKYPVRSVGAINSIRVINQIYAGGQANGAIKAVAYTLPNTESIIEQYGSKRVLLKNVQKAKFNNILLPISKLVISSAQQNFVIFNAFFTQVLAHEMMHGLGPQKVFENGAETSKTLREALGKYYSPIEELKADIGGLWMLSYMMDSNITTIDFGLSSVDATAPANVLAKKALYTTFLAGIFRSVRFGVSESAHAMANAVAFNYMRAKGAITVSQESSKTVFAVNTNEFESAMTKLLETVLEIQAEGDYDDAKSLLEEHGIVTDEMKKIFEGMTSEESTIPVDIIIDQKSHTVSEDSDDSGDSEEEARSFNYRSFLFNRFQF
ncbi:hypothetical protein NAEGRDRAFT_77250 [Naegleria gruberi]|uniref:Peptidase family M49 n=1 Tax=Naegleria gruberi TaxID=5762 RepID=D2V4E5_NAEGR|nr:uncharacterized protein NAEGRDRAFT_77250 [Naegleria gruberi]EFC48500.1 hypothetical protein NAEGRDRAFT_77250 [Naegleria gruberi]|eukprot:XP_002681244.1 hypothetical protein NAEGRDRAFT_77250 [Naegleria gruberi strain NEG-M]